MQSLLLADLGTEHEHGDWRFAGHATEILGTHARFRWI